MENKNIDQYTRSLVQKSGLDKPSTAFMGNILTAISHEAESKIVYKPLISIKSWLLILVISCAMIMVYVFGPESISIIDLKLADNFMPTFNLPHMSISAISLYGIVFLSLFLFQIPILKYYLERRII